METEVNVNMAEDVIESTKSVIRNYILASVKIQDLNDDDKLFESGIVNSLFAVQLMTYLEKTFRIEVTMDDLSIENFESIDSTASFIMKKKLQDVKS